MPFHISLAPSRGKSNGEVVVLIHGLGLCFATMLVPAFYLRRNGYHCLLYDYPTFRYGIDRHASDFSSFLHAMSARFPDAAAFHVVSHSMGGIVSRKALHQKPLPQMKRVVMLAPPNKGSPMAGRVARLPLMRRIMAPITQLDDAPGSYIHIVPVPAGVEIGVIAGTRGDGKGWKWYMEGDDDGKVALKDTHLPGQKDHLSVRSAHTFIMNKPEVLHNVAIFLREGRFIHPGSVGN